MKRVMIYAKIASAALLLVVLQGCSGSLSDSLSLSNSNLETRIATTTELLLDQMENTYNQVQDLTFETEYDIAVAGILSSNAEEVKNSPLVSDSLKLRMQLLQLYRQAVHEYSLLVDNGFKSKLGLFANCCGSILETYKQIDDSVAKIYNKQVMPLVRAARYDKNSVSSHLIHSLADMWAKDKDALCNQLDSSFQGYQASLATIPETVFDEEKLAKYVSAPYNGKHNLIEVYKIELIKERRNTLRELVQQQLNVSTALQYLQHAFDEFVKQPCDNDVVMNYIKRIDILFSNESNVETDNR